MINELLGTLFNPLPNAIMSSLMAVILLYWLLSFFGVSFEDMDVDVDSGIDVDTDVDMDSGVDSTESPNLFFGLLEFLNAGKVPFMVILSCLIFFTWAGSLLITHLTSEIGWHIISLWILLPLLISSFFLTKIATIPLAKLLEKTGYRGEEPINYYGISGKMLSSIQGDKVGVGEFMVDKDPIKFNVVSMDGDDLRYGDEVLIIKQTSNKNIYSVVKNI